MTKSVNKPFDVSIGLNRNNMLLELVAVHYGFFSSSEIWTLEFDQMIPTLFHISSLDDEIELWTKFSQDLIRTVTTNIAISTDLTIDPNKGDDLIKNMLRPNI